MKDHLTPFVEQITHAPATVMAGDVVEPSKVYAVLERLYEKAFQAGKVEGLRDGKAEMQERCVTAAEQDVGSDCPFDLEPDPGIASDEPCPKCGEDGEGDLNKCVSSARVRITNAIRALPLEDKP